ncbi:PTS system D-fructose-specific IIA component (F1P-forming) (Frc family) /PTS system D-fructose-specific IIB component (F1P-forming) (Frc family) /PTS system D-fructose-specific IIC component (F1P-forming) (Frc family) [Thermolongibacillus altinsuensis]|uniref:PTS system D-fructose-specific IIA component (F1P-forming) (Frc family) /PTS system D-fructose-specific IIB component (F1P-forming) (Frc family) /PTS system D-fructose-specific IIC component (F1P-f... n=1 Tax=Thermolongibacillus altinsuensis TaxID=575256 RepID=A0A4R1QKS4_9BACL|nr:PTS fructose transporter subunit IIABC [Thermolongibacillus altinsuensis]TCL48060.1 PTS system D-fructose-specific IIA component (F1P-forming) (Frc family) /PTS system D-fructose-specific IIB component (F1P-forming) (Frc family) /PTS system D-fructose-specific IIC component (F1P-forming) (Frc family) [Thermolongibacillus altinsuensis]
MKITDLLKEETIVLHLKAKTKEEVIDELADVLDRAGKLNDKQMFKQAIFAREAQSTTGIGEGIAIPHAKTKAVRVPAVAFGRSQEGVDYEALDGKPSHLFFMIAAPEGANNTHLEALSRLSTLLMDASFRAKIENASTKEEVIQAIEKKEAELMREETAASPAKKKILAVTACPTGIAHTYMAADALKAKAKEMNVDIKVETNGSSGVKNELTKEDIEEAVAIIVAADKQVEMERFKGKHVIQVPVAHAIRKPEQLIEQALKQDAPIYQGSGSEAKTYTGSSGERKGFYKHLMNGVSNMLPFVVGGGILIAISFIFGIKAFDPNDPSFHPVAKALMDIGGGSAFALMIPVLAGFIAMSIADRPGFAPGMVGGFMAANGGAGFLGGLIAGFLAGYLVVGLKKLFSRLPQSLEGIKPVLLYPLFGILVTGLIMMYVVIDPVKALNDGMKTWLENMGTGNLVLLGLILGGMMAVDMGGPINKAAFTFGIAMIDAGNYAPHAAIMAGGMVPPLGLALATTFFKNKFTKAEREAGKTCYIMGASFITEGAIPFAAADPGRVIPSIIVGSAIAGALTMMFGIGLPAPHGGIFVIPIVKGNPLLYVLAILIGSIVTAVMVGLWKKEVKEE